MIKSAKEPLGIEEMIKIQNDVQSKIFYKFKFIFENLKGKLEEENLEELNEKILNWDGMEHTESIEASFFETW